MMDINAFLLSSTGSLLITSNCPSANWPSSTVDSTPTPSWCSRCGRKSWRKASVSTRGAKGGRRETLLDELLIHHVSPEVSANVSSRLELADTVAMSPVDRMRSTSLKLVSLGKIYAGTPRYFPLGKRSYSCNHLHVSTH